MADNDEELNLKGPAGLGLSFKGQQMFPVILVLLLAAFFGYLVYQSDGRSAERDAHTHSALEKLLEATQKSENAQKAMIYVLALPQIEREKLNLMKPRELSEMQR